jgi:hypothetical protein
MKKKYRKRGLQSLNQNTAQLTAEKKKTHLQFLQTKTEAEYKRIRAIVKKETGIHINSWYTYISNTEHDVHGRQEIAYRILRELNKTERDTTQLILYLWMNG